MRVIIKFWSINENNFILKIKGQEPQKENIKTKKK